MAEKKAASKFSWDDETYYEVTLARSTAYPPGSNNILPMGAASLKMKGKAAKRIEADIADAKPIAKPT